MESIIRNVKDIESPERRVYESLLGQSLRDNQRVLVMILNPGAEPDESIRRKAMADFHELCRQGTERRQQQGASVEQADQVLEEAVRAVRSRKTDGRGP
jgi:hypothetical protein